MQRQLFLFGLMIIFLFILLGFNCTGKIVAGSDSNSPTANKETLEEWLQKIDHVGQYRDIKILNTIPKEKIIVVRNDGCDENIKKAGGKKRDGSALSDGNRDRIQDVLTTLNIPHTLIGKSELEKDSYSLDDKWALIFNCNLFQEHCCNPEHLKQGKTLPKDAGYRSRVCPGTDPHQVHKTKLSDKTINKIKQFVETGGYLFTEDLQIEEIIVRAFKGTIFLTKYLREEDVIILPSPGAEKHPYLKYVFESPVQPQDGNIEIKWKIDNESPDIRIRNENAVTALIVSPQLKREKEGKVVNEGIVAVTFSVSDTTKGKSSGGQVLHIMTHFNKQPSKIGEFALQNLLVNFLIEMAEKRK